MKLFLFTLFILSLNGVTQKITAQNTDTVKPIEPPFSLNWGESPDNTINWVNTNQLEMVRGKIQDGRTVIEVIGPFPNVEFDRIRFYFSNNTLTEVELQFIQTGNVSDEIEFSSLTSAIAIKTEIDNKIGTGILIKNEKGKHKDSEWNFVQQIWTDEEHAIWLTIFSTKTPQKGSLSIVSLHYRWEKKLKNP